MLVSPFDFQLGATAHAAYARTHNLRMAAACTPNLPVHILHISHTTTPLASLYIPRAAATLHDAVAT